MPETRKYETQFFSALRDIFVGAKIEGDSGYINLMRIKSRYYEQGVFPLLKRDIDKALQPFPDFREELFDKLYTFFQRYFSESGSIYFRYTSLHQNVYEKVYTDDRDVMLFWKTHMLYYVKTDRIFNSLAVEVDGFKFFFDATNMELKRSNEKRETIYTFRSLNEDGALVFDVAYSERGRTTKIDEILKALRQSGQQVTDDTLTRAFRVFEKQSEVDYFINKNARVFLQEQFDLWMYQYLFTGHNIWSEERLAQLQVLKEIAFKTIDFISQFEDELVRIWNKPKFVRNCNYIVTLDHILDKPIFQKLMGHPGMLDQINEWIVLGIVPSAFSIELIVQQKRDGSYRYPKYHFLPIDTQYFKDIELDILSEFENLDEQIDGWLIHSENYQALLTINQKFLSKVQTIYIDPPFNLGSEADFHYSVNYEDSTWLTILENRINMSKNLLKSDGNIFVRCDFNGNMLVRLLLDKLIGDNFFKNEIILNRFKKKSDGFTNNTESLFFYSFGKLNKLTKPRECIFCKQTVEPQWQWSHSAGAGTQPRYFKINGERVLLYPPRGRHWTNSQETIDKLESEGRIRFDPSTNYTDCNNNRVKGIPEKLQDSDVELDNNWTDLPGYEFGVYTDENFPTQNAEVLLERVIAASTKEGDLVMDYFLGSGTTIAVAHRMKRKWIGIELGNHFNTKVVPRIKRVLFGRGNEDTSKSGLIKYFEMEQYEDTLHKAIYRDADLFNNPYEDPFHSYIFLRDEKMLSALDVDTANNAVHVHPERLYPDIDLAETISQRRGKWIKRITREYVEFQDGEKQSLIDPDWQVLKPLIWW